MNLLGWLIIGKIGVAGAVALGALAAAWFFRSKLALIVAAGAVGFTAIYSMGVYDAGEQCKSEFAAAEERFRKLEAEIAHLTEEHAATLKTELETKDKANEAIVKQIEERLAKAAACPLDEHDVRDVNSVRDQRANSGAR